MDKANYQNQEPGKQAEETPVIPDACSKKRARKQNDVFDLGGRLDALGLKIVHVTADGNCLFRALADQIEGDEDKHRKYRKKVVRFIKKNRERFEPFIEDEVPFNEYCCSMGEDGTWAGHMELQAASLVTRSNICIHMDTSPHWYIKNFGIHEARMIHLSYHGGEHYNSVRSKNDTCYGPARPIVIMDDADLLERSNQPKAVGMQSKRSIKFVNSGTGGNDSGEKQALQQVSRDADAAVKVLVANQGSLELNKDASWLQVTMFEVFPDEHQNEHFEQQHQDKTCELKLVGNGAEITDKKNLQRGEKKILRIKMCPCGSKKAYMSCCSSSAGIPSAEFLENQVIHYGQTRRFRKQGRKGSSRIATSSIQSNGRPRDMGQLCI